jgi:hypothetical protein
MLRGLPLRGSPWVTEADHGVQMSGQLDHVGCPQVYADVSWNTFVRAPKSNSKSKAISIVYRHELVSYPQPKSLLFPAKLATTLRNAPCSVTAYARTACTPRSVDRVQAQLASTEGLPCSVDWCPGDTEQLRAFAPWTRGGQPWRMQPVAPTAEAATSGAAEAAAAAAARAYNGMVCGALFGWSRALFGADE